MEQTKYPESEAIIIQCTKGQGMGLFSVVMTYRLKRYFEDRKVNNARKTKDRPQ